MAWNFADQIHALTGYDADNTADSETDEDFNLLANQWLVDAAKEVIHVLPQKLKMKCVKISALTSSTPMDLDSAGEILHVTREDDDSGYHIGCREINAIYGGSADDSTSLHKASETDPVYWVESDTGGDPKLFVKPDPTSNQPARIHHVSYPPNSTAWDGTYLPGLATSISNFPDEAEYLVVLRAAITAAEYLLAQEEDTELYIPIIASLKAQYQEGVYALKAGQFAPTKQDIKIARAGAK
tara:strand:- start:396 stop:1118 length:723 start_codon:yes stop_codon:yes gene_type:complete